ncbi:MAG: hypothetical protein AAGA48_04040 [Myxococcota bacterium]
MLDEGVLEREDVALFINAATTCTGQSEFYGDAREQRVSLGFLHDYVFGNYRRLYALCLAAGINHFNRAAIVHRLLAAGAPSDPVRRVEEAALIAGALRQLPPQRVYRLFTTLRHHRVNNRRSRATIHTWLAQRPDLTFDAVKYRGPLRSALRHAHLPLDVELREFLFEGPNHRPQWSAPLLDAFRRARYDQRAIYELPYTVAEGLAATKGIPRERFLKTIEPRLTAAERVRLNRLADDGGWATLDLERVPLDRLCVLVLAQPVGERSEAFRAALNHQAKRVWRGQASPAQHIHVVLDNSFSSRSGAQKRNQALAVTLGCTKVLEAGAKSYRRWWTSGATDDLRVTPRGQTDLATPLLAALEGKPDLVVVVSDGFDNDPPGAAGEVVRLFRTHIDPKRHTTIVHVNPVFDAQRFMPRPLGPGVPMVGIRDPANLPLKLGFASFVHGSSRIEALEAWLLKRAEPWLREVP